MLSVFDRESRFGWAQRWIRAVKGDIMRRTSTLLALIGALTLTVVVPAQAQGAPPPVREIIPFENVVEGFVPECDRTLRWDIDGQIRQTTFFDRDGDVAKTHWVVTELNTITDVDNDVTLNDGPFAFVQTTTFNADGTQLVEISGLSAIVVGGENLVIDVGRLVLLIHPDPEQSVVLHESGRHDLRDLDPFTLTAEPFHLQAFCPAFV